MSEAMNEQPGIEKLLSNRAEFLNFIRRRVDSPEAAEDILQGAFVRAVEKQSIIRDEESSVAWFYRILRNAVIDHYRSKATRDRVLEAWPEGLDAPGPATTDITNEICQCVNAVLAGLKPEYAEALKQVDVQERPITELAADKGITNNNATVRVHRAREALRKRVEEACGSCAEHECVDCHCRKPK